MNLKKFFWQGMILLTLIVNYNAESIKKVSTKNSKKHSHRMSMSKKRKLISKIRNKKNRKKDLSTASDVSEISQNNQSSSQASPSANKIQFGYKLLDALLLPSIQYSHLFGYLNVFFNELYITDKDIKKMNSDNESLFVLFLKELTTYAKKQQLEKNEITMIAKKIAESIKDQKQLPDSFLTENMYQIGVGNFTFEAISSYRTKYQNKNTAILNELLSNKTIIHDENITFKSLQMQKKKHIKATPDTIEQYANQFYYYIINAEREQNKAALLSTSYFQNIIYAFIMHVQLSSIKYKKLLLKHIAKHNKNQSKEEIQKLFVEYTQAGEQAAIIIEKLWQALVACNAFPTDLHEIVTRINKAGGFVAFTKDQIKPETEESSLFRRVAKIAGTAASIGAGLYLANKYSNSKPFTKAAEFLWEKGKSFFNPITEKIHSWWKETDTSLKIWDVASGSWIGKAIEAPINVTSHIINSKIFDAAYEKTQGGGGITKFIIGGGAKGLSLLIKTYITAKATSFIRQKIGSTLYDANIYRTLKDKISNLLYNQNLYYISIDNFEYLNQSLYLFELIQNTKSIELLINDAKEDNDLLKLSSQTGEFLETIFVGQLEQERQERRYIQEHQRIEEKIIEKVRNNRELLQISPV